MFLAARRALESNLPVNQIRLEEARRGCTDGVPTSIGAAWACRSKLFSSLALDQIRAGGFAFSSHPLLAVGVFCLFSVLDVFSFFSFFTYPLLLFVSPTLVLFVASLLFWFSVSLFSHVVIAILYHCCDVFAVQNLIFGTSLLVLTCLFSFLRFSLFVFFVLLFVRVFASSFVCLLFFLFACCYPSSLLA